MFTTTGMSSSVNSVNVKVTWREVASTHAQGTRIGILQRVPCSTLHVVLSTEVFNCYVEYKTASLSFVVRFKPILVLKDFSVLFS